MSSLRPARLHRQHDLLEIPLRVQAQYAVGAEYEIEVAAMRVGVDLIPQLVADEHSSFAVDNVLVFAC
jgi:hypothetical protein